VATFGRGGTVDLRIGEGQSAVPVSNSLHLLTAMRAAGRPVEAHLFQEGGHAFASG
jgi:dipeptidyl aminopeptidase/acylaminoacyl peptidase